MKKALLALCLLVIAALACQPLQGQTETSQPPPPLPPTDAPITPAPTKEIEATQPPIAPTEPPAAPALPTAPLTQTGPWVVFSKPDGLYVSNMDGSGITKIFDAAPYMLPASVAPKGGRFAFITATDGGGNKNLTLHILHLSDGKVEKSIPLTGPQTEPGPDAQPGDAVYQLLWVFGDSQWSPDGSMLAFEAGIDGDSSDLYLYTVATGEIKRLTTGPAQDYSPIWSPDGKYIAHLGASNFGTGAGYEMVGAWLTQVSDNTITDIYKPDSGSETFLGWSDPQTIVVYSFFARCSTGKLRTVNVTTGKETSLWPGYFSQDQIAFDPGSGTSLLFTGDLTWCDSNNPEPGGYLIHTDGTRNRIPDLLSGIPRWSPEAGMFTVYENYSAIGIKPDGTSVSMPPELTDIPFFAPDGVTFAWRSESGAEMFRNGTVIHLADTSMRTPSEFHKLGGGIYNFPPPAIWSPDSLSLLFIGDDGNLYVALASNNFVALVASDAGDINGGLFFFKVEP